MLVFGLFFFFRLVNVCLFSFKIVRSDENKNLVYKEGLGRKLGFILLRGVIFLEKFGGKLIGSVEVV